MEINEVIAMLDAIQMAYPRFTQNYSEDKMPKVVQMWYQFFKDEDAVEVSAVLNKYIATTPFPPSIADIKNKLNTLKATSESDLWEELITACKRSLGTEYPSVENGLSEMTPRRIIQYAKLSKPLQLFVGNARGLEEFFYTQRDEPTKAKRSFDKYIGKFIEECEAKELKQEIAERHEQLTYNADGVKKLEDITKGMFK